MSDLSCVGTLDDVFRLSEEKLFADVLDLYDKVDSDCDFLNLNTDVKWFVNEFEPGDDDTKRQQNPSVFIKREPTDPDDEDSDQTSGGGDIGLIDGLLSKNFGHIQEEVVMDQDRDGYCGYSSSNSSETNTDDTMHNIFEIQDREEEYFTLTEEEVPKAVSTIVVDSGDSQSSFTFNGDSDSYNSQPQFTSTVEMHHNYCCSQKLDPVSGTLNGGRLTRSPNRGTNNSQFNSFNSRGSSRSKAITDLVLTDEEKRLLAKEGYHDFPSGTTGLTKQEEKVLRKIRRKIRNKRSAQCSRQRKKEYLDDLERKFEKCSNDNHLLRRENLKLKKANETLLLKLKKLIVLQTGSSNEKSTSMTNGSSGGQTSFKTSFLVLVLSFLLIIFPYFRPDGLDESSFSLSKSEFSGTGRQLLTVMASNETGTGGDPYHYYSAYYDLNDSLTAMLDYAVDGISSSLREL